MLVLPRVSQRLAALSAVVMILAAGQASVAAETAPAARLSCVSPLSTEPVAERREFVGALNDADEGRAFVDFNGDKLVDYCRVNALPNESHLACTDGASGRTVVSAPLDAGYPTGRGWADFDGDGRADFCRLVGPHYDQHIACTLSRAPRGARPFSTTIVSAALDWGYETGRAWTDFNGDGKADYCRVVGTNNRQKVACTLSAGRTFGATIESDALDWGYETAGRLWADVNNDEKADYCREVGEPTDQRIACTLSTGRGFGRTVTTKTPWGWPSGRAYADVDGDGRADFCRIVGDADSPRLACNSSLGETFAPLREYVLTDARSDNGRVWADVDGDGRAEFCRFLGAVAP